MLAHNSCLLKVYKIYSVKNHSSAEKHSWNWKCPVSKHKQKLC